MRLGRKTRPRAARDPRSAAQRAVRETHSRPRYPLPGCVPAEPGSVFLGAAILESNANARRRNATGLWRDNRVRRPCAERSLTGLHDRDLFLASVEPVVLSSRYEDDQKSSAGHGGISRRRRFSHRGRALGRRDNRELPPTSAGSTDKA